MKIKNISTTALVILLIVAILGTTFSVFSAFGIKFRNFFSKHIECNHELIAIPGQAPTCTELGWNSYYACSKCNYSTKTFIKETGHNISDYDFNHGDFDVHCLVCGLNQDFFGVSTYDGSEFYGVSGNSNNFTVKYGTEKPYRNNEGNLQYVKTTPTGDYKQAQFWLLQEGSNPLNLSTSENTVGFISFCFNANVSRSFEMMLVEGATSDRWSSNWCIPDTVFAIKPIVYGEGYAEYSFVGIGNMELKRVVSVQDAYTGWYSLEIGIVLDEVADTVRFFYYLNDEYVGTAVTKLTTEHNSIRNVYCSAKTANLGSGIIIDSFTAGSSNDPFWAFNEQIN